MMAAWLTGEHRFRYGRPDGFLCNRPQADRGRREDRVGLAGGPDSTLHSFDRIGTFRGQPLEGEQAVEKTVARLLENKGSEVWSIDPDATVYSALELLAEKGIGALVVVRDDLLVASCPNVTTPGRLCSTSASPHYLVREIMTSSVHTVTEASTTAACMELMTNQRIRHLPVVEGDRIVGLISIGDVVRSVIEEQRFLIEQLEGYITG